MLRSNKDLYIRSNRLSCFLESQRRLKSPEDKINAFDYRFAREKGNHKVAASDDGAGQGMVLTCV
jgi:hypothetical protein